MGGGELVCPVQRLADFYRITQDWSKFDEMVAKIEARNPDSVGLLFLRGVEARDRKGDPNQAKSYLEQALWRDQLFVRARVHAPKFINYTQWLP